MEPAPEPPAAFPPTFLYHVSWEDGAVDRALLRPTATDRVLTLTSGGDNALAYLLHRVENVTAVDVNPAQSALLELKAAAARTLPYEDLWRLLGEGSHERAASLFDAHLAPWLSQSATSFWRPRVGRYFDGRHGGLYARGGHGAIFRFVRAAAGPLGLNDWLSACATAPTLADQIAAWDAGWPVAFAKRAPAALVSTASAVVTSLLLNRFTLWFGGGIPTNQWKMICADGVRLSTYIARTLDGVARACHVKADNPYYHVSLMGRFDKDTPVEWLKPESVAALRESDALDKLSVVTEPFLDALSSRGPFSIVVLMDHVDWTDAAYAHQMAASLAANVPKGGRVIWRSAAYSPWYTETIAAAGFDVACVARADTVKGGYMDRVNSYASFWVGVRREG